MAPFIGDRTPRILVVDDEPAHRRVLADYLTLWGCTVHTAANGEEALSGAAGFNPDLILLDIMMPGPSGFEVCDALRTDHATGHTPVIFLTALSGEEARIRGFDSGGLDYVVKPFIAADLAARVGARLRQRYAEDELRARNRELSQQLAKGRSKTAPGADE